MALESNFVLNLILHETSIFISKDDNSYNMIRYGFFFFKVCLLLLS